MWKKVNVPVFVVCSCELVRGEWRAKVLNVPIYCGYGVVCLRVSLYLQLVERVRGIAERKANMCFSHL